MKTYPPLSIRVASLALAAIAPHAGHSEIVTLPPVADTSLFSSAPDHNLGANLSIAVGNNAGASPIRGLIRFDPAASIPAGSRILSASLGFQVVRIPILPEPTTFDLHRVLVSWGEGTGGGGGGVGTGTLASAGEATWDSRFHGSLSWSQPGGAAGTDFATSASGSADNTAAEPLNFDSTAELVADVQTWLNTPASNFGWLIKDRFENADSTARRLASREDASRAPALTIEYVRETPLRVTVVLDGNGNVCFRFTAEPGKAYKLERREQVDSGDWTTIATREPTETGGETSLCDPLNTTALSRFYRVSGG